MRTLRTPAEINISYYKERYLVEGDYSARELHDDNSNNFHNDDYVRVVIKPQQPHLDPVE